MTHRTEVKKLQVYLRSFTASLGFFAYGYTIGVFNSSLSCVSSILNWGESSRYLISLMSALVLFGGSLGAILAGFMSQLFGKRKNLLISDITMIIGSLLCSFPQTVSFGIGRFICGFASGSFSMLCSSYITEFSPSSMSASMGSLNQISMVLGILSSNSICMALPVSSCDSNIGFQVFSIFSLPGIVCFIQLVLLLTKFKQESPVWLVKCKDFEAAVISAEGIYEEKSVVVELEKLKRELNVDNNTAENPDFNDSSYKEILTCAQKVKKAMRVGVLIHIFQQLSGINGVMFYSTLLFEKLAGSVLYARIYTVIGTTIRVFSLVIVFPCINRISKKKISVTGAILMTCCCLVLVFTIDYAQLAILNVILVFLFLGIFTNTVGQVPWFYSSIIMPDKGVSLAAGVNFLTGTAVVMTFPFILELLGLKVTFGLYSFFNFIAAIYFWRDLVDFRRMSSFQIRKFLSTMK